MRIDHLFLLAAVTMLLPAVGAQAGPGYPIVDTAQVHCYDDRDAIAYPKPGEAYHGQDAQYRANEPAYRDHGDGTVSDLVTGLMWTKKSARKMTWAEAMALGSACRVGGHDDWRLPSVKELYSLIRFDGLDPDPRSEDTRRLKPFIDPSVFDFSYGNPANGERIIDSQFATSTLYTSTTMRGDRTMFGVNFADGRIKGYPVDRSGPRLKTYHVLYVRGNPEYGKNRFVDNGDGTVTDHATGLTWTKADSGEGMNWRAALKHAEDLEIAGHDDWRLPSAKELQSLVDYTRSPDATGTAAIDPVFRATVIVNEGGEKDFGSYWTSTSHGGGHGARAAVYVAFGRAGGFMGGRDGGPKRLLDVHGAGAQRSDPKSGDASRYPEGRGPQGDVIRIENLVRCVRGGGVRTVETGPPVEPTDRRGRDDRPQDVGDRFLRRFDRNDDGKVTREEFDGPARRFQRVDRDGDGIITREEAAAAPSPRGRRGQQPGGGRRQAPEPRPEEPQGDETTEAPPRRAAGSAPSIILILADDLGWTGLSARMDDRVEESGSDFYRTPRIDELAAEGIRFSQAYAPAAMCTPTRASILTGKTPAELHITTPGRGGRPDPSQKLIGASQRRELPSSEITIAEALKQAGYATAHFGKWHLPGGDPGDHGFEVHDGATGNGGPGTYEDPNPKDIFGLTDRAVAFMRKQAAADRPFYIHLSHYAVHSPTLARSSSKAQFGKLPSGTRHRDVEFAAMTHDLDTGIGMLLDELDELGLADDTYVVFMSDNGAAGGNRRRRSENLPLRGGKGGFYEGGIRVPLIVRGPGIEPGSLCRERVIGYDLLPTFCGWAGVATPGGVEGEDLASLLTGRSERFERSEPVLLFHYPHYGHGPQKPQSAIILGDHKLIKSHETGALQLFDLAADLSEANDLSKREPELLVRMARELARRLEETKAQMPAENPDHDPEASPTGQRRPGGRGERGGRGRDDRR